MAIRKPLVIGSDGLIQQLQSGDTVGAIETGQVTLTAAAALTKGNAVYVPSAGNVNKARANAAGTSKVVGIVPNDISNGATGTVQVNGVVTLTTAEWDAITGQTGGLTAGSIYFLSAATAGLLTTTAPSTVGQLVVRVGIALSATEMSVSPGDPILL